VTAVHGQPGGGWTIRAASEGPRSPPGRRVSSLPRVSPLRVKLGASPAIYNPTTDRPPRSLLSEPCGGLGGPYSAGSWPIGHLGIDRIWQADAVSSSAAVQVRPARSEDQDWIADLLRRSWGSTTAVSRGRAHQADTLPAIVAETKDGGRGLATFQIENGEAELVTINADPSGRGIGRALLTALVDACRAEGCRRVWLTTTNDNLDAVRFYQRQGFRLVALHPGAVDEARKIKPTIPLERNGIPIHDELELALILVAGA
jgi:ribosomal protein S18 acetylase RimI-like enzyme